MPDPERTVIDAIKALVRRRHEEVEVRADSLISDMLDSLEVAELSAVLEDTLGRDPYSEGVVPRTVGALVAWYAT